MHSPRHPEHNKIRIDTAERQIDKLSTNFEEFNRAVKFLSAKYDKLLPQVQQINEKLHQHTQSIHAAKDELGKVKKSATDAMSQIEELSQYVRRDCLEISGIKPTGECTCENIVTSIVIQQRRLSVKLRTV